MGYGLKKKKKKEQRKNGGPYQAGCSANNWQFMIIGRDGHSMGGRKGSYFKKKDELTEGR